MDARAATRRALERLRAEGALPGGDTPWVVFALGKAAAGMLAGAAEVVPIERGVAYAPAPFEAPPGVEVFVGGHPVPCPEAADQGRAALRLASSLGLGEWALALISGGGSALFEVPVPGVRVEALGEASRRLMEAGFDIHALNAFRAGLSQVKAGRLAAAIAPATLLSLVLDDVPGGDPREVASGPTAPRSVRVPAAVWEVVPELRARWEAPPEGPGGRLEVVADDEAAARAVVEAARAWGLRVGRAGRLFGEAREVGLRFYAEARARCAAEGLDGLVATGETTVRVEGPAGRGGRNQELVLAAAPGFEGGLLGALGTDGVDGASTAAGALLDAEILAAARGLGRDPAAHLARHDSEAFFEGTPGRIETGPTGTNVADLTLYLA